MFWASSRFVLLEEPIDDLRSKEKRSTAAARDLFLELQQAVGYPHFPHLAAEQLLREMRHRGRILYHRVMKSDRPVAFDDYFSTYPDFARRSDQAPYWLGRLASFRDSLGKRSLCEDDTILLLAQK
jgi:hypothetical protein